MNHNQLIEYFAQVIQEIFNKVGSATNLTDDKNAQKLISAVLKSLDTLGIKANEVMPQELEKAYQEAVASADKELAVQNVKVEKVEPTQILKRKIHLAAVKKIISDTLIDLKTAIETAKNSAKTTIKNVLSRTKKEIANGMLLGNHRRIVSKRVAKAFQEEGLTAFVTAPDKNGVRRKLRLDKYANTVVSSKMREASTNGTANRCLESNVGLVQVSKHSPTCHVCARYEGLVISLNGQHDGFKSVLDNGVKLPGYHPHCKHTIKPWVIDYKTPAEIQTEKDKWKSFNPEKEVRSVAQQKAYKKEQDIRRKAHEELKAYERYTAVLGKDAPKTIGAFRRIKRNGGKSWQKLHLAYRQANRELKVE